MPNPVSDWPHEDKRAATHLTRLGVNPVVVNRMQEWAREDGMSLREFAAYVLSDYTPAIIDGSDEE